MIAFAAAVANAVEVPFAPTRNFTDVRVRLHPFTNARRLRETCADELGVVVSTSEPGCAKMLDVCDVYVLIPAHSEDRERMAIVGHEVMHCFYGAYHAEGGKL